MRAISDRSSCDRGKVGCVIIRDNRILVTGYAGAPPGLSHCDEVGHRYEGRFHGDLTPLTKQKVSLRLEPDEYTVHCIRTIHAEQNAILQAAKLGISLAGSTLYCSMTPCRVCTMFIISVGIVAVHCESKYQCAQESEEMLKQAGIPVTYVSENVNSYK